MKGFPAMTFLRSLLGRVSSVEKWTLTSFVIAALLVLSFALLASEVAEGETRAFDERILLLFRTPGDLSRTIGPPWLKEAMRDITALGGTSVLAILVAGVAGFLAVSGLRHAAIMVVASVLSGVLLSNSLKAGFSRARPDLVPHDTVIYTASFPSGHATLSAVVYLTLGALLCRTQSSVAVKAYILSVAAFLTMIVGVSRVYLGVHWPTDVIAGWLLGGTWALLCWFVMVWLQSRGEVEPEQPDGSQKV
jgi:undecaprenyl-diphosphatase